MLKRVLTQIGHVSYFPRYIRDFIAYNRMHPPSSLRATVMEAVPILQDFHKDAGTASGHYFHQDLHVARLIFARRPARHVDIGSRIDGFVAHLLTFMEVDVVDIRPLHSKLPGLRFLQADASRLEQFADNSIDSISSLHAAEHFGLGRYGDPINPQSCLDFMAALKRVLAPGGRLYFSVPVGRERLQFNGQRILSPLTVMRAFDDLKLVSFAYVGDDNDLYLDQDPTGSVSLEDGCGIFEFTRQGPA